MQHLRHAMHWARKRLEGDFDEIAFLEGRGQLQEAAVHRNCLDTSFGVLSVFQFHEGRSEISELDSRRPMGRVRLGEVGHSGTTMSYIAKVKQITKDRLGLHSAKAGYAVQALKKRGLQLLSD